MVREQLGLPIYSYTEEASRAVELPRSEHPDVSFFNDIDVNQWKVYDEIITDSLWLIGSRDKSGAHTAELHGNFIPQIPHQAMLRYTKRGEVVLDTFLGSGTTLIECKRLGRYGIGIELLPILVERSRELIAKQSNSWNVKTKVIQGDSCLPATMQDVQDLLRKEYGRDKVQLIIMHPPYHDIIKFSDDPRDLCNSPTVADFLENFGVIVRNSYDLLEDKRFLVLVIGDKYTKGEWVPLGFYTMQKVIENGYKLKSLVVKNIVGNRAKRNLEHFWRRRALKWGFYVFKHEYVMFFQKVRETLKHDKTSI
ncbi:MAG: DNA methylase [Chloroflexi bacterium CG_4_9_14_3_um_filter_45_9]|nr:MAG: DNA methylase [Chloroflexi bacterium CG08_land_8_20_14_0_20_45_12]PIX26859.1 MAG: DNA methylase [Chloroflexi bacterium CG_4_8_14_3_um_filter_45_15]PJB50001.1 MAG: DNA methylase [Chloroflexi bacterium CG_4_9_14_3_um_filter_45_9]